MTTPFRRSQFPKTPPRPTPSASEIEVEVDLSEFLEEDDGDRETPLLPPPLPPPRPKKKAAPPPLPPPLKLYALLEGSFNRLPKP